MYRRSSEPSTTVGEAICAVIVPDPALYRESSFRSDEASQAALQKTEEPSLPLSRRRALLTFVEQLSARH
jgi:hypothetical protein